VPADGLDGEVDGVWLVEREGDPVEEARAYLGCPYEWGGMTEQGIDCSGLIHMAYRRLGRLVPRDADQQEAAGTPIASDDLRRGDLVCYGDHVAFWVGDGRILHATGREGVRAVVEEEHPPDLAARVRRYVRL
jgi:cell wall-associated NlpC family hydrolase